MNTTEFTPDLSTAISFNQLDSIFLSPDFYQPALTAFSIFIVLTLICLFRRKNNLLSAKLIKTEKNLANTEKELEELKQKLHSTLEFQKSLGDAEITTRLQQSRLTTQHSSTPAKTPERYRYVKSLSENGMDAEEIASVLSISAQEAAQLVNLSRLVGTPS